MLQSARSYIKLVQLRFRLLMRLYRLFHSLHIRLIGRLAGKVRIELFFIGVLLLNIVFFCEVGYGGFMDYACVNNFLILVVTELHRL